MDYQEKRSYAGILATVVLYAVYLSRLLDRIGEQGDAFDLVSAARFMLIFIGISIVVRIVMEILLAIGNAIVTRNDKEPGQLDEMDKIIDLKSERFGYGVAGAGFPLSLAALLLGYPPIVMINIVFLFFYIADLTASVLRIIFYRRGLV